MKSYFLPEAHSFRKKPVSGYFETVPVTWTRPLVLGALTVLVCVLHIVILIWFMGHPEQKPITGAKALPSIDIALTAPAAKLPSLNPERSKSAVEPKTLPKQPSQVVKPKPKLVAKLKQIPVPVKLAQKQPEQSKQEIEPAQSAPQASTASPNLTASAAPSSARSSVPQASEVKTVAAAVNSDSYANYINSLLRNYPLLARENHWEGLVKLKVQIDPQGNVSAVLIKKSSGHTELDEAAVADVKMLRFTPSRRGDVPVSSWVTVPVEYELD